MTGFISYSIAAEHLDKPIGSPEWASLKTNEPKSPFRALLRQKQDSGGFDSNLREELLLQAFHRSQYLISASHITLTLERNAADKITLDAYNRIEDLYHLVRSSPDLNFDSVPAVNTVSPFKILSGKIDYFMVFEQPYEIENAAFSTPLGTVSRPFRSNFGFHVLKVEKVIKLDGVRKASQIMLSVSDENSNSHQIVKQRIEQIHSLTSSTIFEELVDRYSDNVTSKLKSGDLGTGRLINTLESVKQTLALNQISRPVRSSFGWHILKLTEIAPLPGIAELSRQDIAKSRLSARLSSISNDFNSGQMQNFALQKLLARYRKSIPASGNQP